MLGKANNYKESKSKLQHKSLKLQEENKLIDQKHYWQRVIFALSFLINFTLNYDFDVCVNI